MFDKLERYKIVIGDFWEWSDNYGASKILKLKLATIIHLEHGVKELIKGVEDLYLDEVNGISNVLYHLNGEGFPLLKHIHIQNNGEIQHIINSMERKLSHVFFPKLETLILQNLNKLEKICHGSFTNNSFVKLRSIKVKCCGQLEYLLSMLMVKALCQLDEIEVSDCNSMKKIVFMENSFSNSVTVDDDIEFCSLRSLTLRYLSAIEDFYSANSFHKLAKLSVENCRSLKCLFSASMVRSFPNLKELEIGECEMMEEIIVTEGRNDAAIEEVGLTKLETVVISNMERLKKVWHSQFDGLKTMEVNNCGKLENIFPSDMHITFERMETLKVSDCCSVKEIFQLPAIEEDTRKTRVTQLKKLHLLHLPKLKQIWSKDPQGTFRFRNLQDVHVEDCETLEYLFPFSIAMDLHQLEQLTMNFCGIDEIVAKKEGPMEDEAIFHFDRLYCLQIWNMRQLDRFYSGSHSLMCPSLRILDVFRCAQLKLLGRQSTINQRKNGDDQNSHLYFAQQPLFVIEEVIPKLEEWTLNNKDAKLMLIDPQWKDHYLSKLKRLRMSNFDDKLAATFLDSIVQKAPNLKDLIIDHSSLSEIFRDERAAYKEGENKINTQLEFLLLYNLQLQHICREGCKIDPILEVLEILCVKKCANLKTLVPSSVTFSHLTYLEIIECNGLINLIYSSTATSLVNLQGITLKECNSLEEIVTQGMKEARDEIIFRSLRTLELESLQRLNSFSSSHYFFRFLLLERVVVRHCPRMKTFCERATSTPMLRKVIIKEGEDEEWFWEGDLNRTITKIYEDKADQIVDTTEQEISELPSSSDDDEQKEKASSTDPQDAEKSHDPSSGTVEMCDTIKKSSISTSQIVPSSTMIPSADGSGDACIEAQKMCDTTMKPSSDPTTQNVPNSTMIPDAAPIDPSPAKALEPMTSSILESNTHSGHKWFSDIPKQNLPYLEAGVKRHPQVLDWFGTKRRRVFASLFIEVTRILRTTRRCDLTEDDQSYIKECCTALEAIGFDASWLSYVHGCIESRGDGNQLMRKLEETEAKVSALRNELASAEACLVSLRDEANRLHNFIES
ncbi:uncharacterized protein LOC114745204 [Neltuma alba]|uniref:uncharacterized protein LOC114745204 n=1 Tax=Neltuma alba TaxID=207710 RepID=UPI0010A4878D|nr:uncharacterized protein LOC114745204 [Prosopis alba]